MTVLATNRYAENLTTKKALGAVYTPPRIASALVTWAVRAASDRVLDPSCGDGVFLEAAKRRLRALGNDGPACTGVDIDPAAAGPAGAICADFFEWAQQAPRYDAIVGNPPFIRSHLFPEHSRAKAFALMRQMGLEPSRLMSSWAPFVAVSANLLSPDGRLALVVPEELLHVGYAKPLREYLLTRFRRTVVCFPDDDIFPSVQQAVVLLLCDNEGKSFPGLHTMAFSDLEAGLTNEAVPAPPWAWSRKWTHLFLSEGERRLVSDGFSQLHWKPLCEYGRVEVGVVTGYNALFIVSRQEAHRLADARRFVPVICGARDLKGIELTRADFAALADAGRPCYLLKTADDSERLSAKLQEYLKEGEKEGVNRRFKCRIRDPWYAVPSVWPAHALLLRQAGDLPRLVHLTKTCTCTDTIHRVRWRMPAHGKRHVVGFLNTWTLIACELMGRSYGGGVLELMPGEANQIPLPKPLARLERLFTRVDALVREGRSEDAIALVDGCVLANTKDSRQRGSIRDILIKLVARRKDRSNGNHSR